MLLVEHFGLLLCRLWWYPMVQSIRALLYAVFLCTAEWPLAQFKMDFSEKRLCMANNKYCYLMHNRKINFEIVLGIPGEWVIVPESLKEKACGIFHQGKQTLCLAKENKPIDGWVNQSELAHSKHWGRLDPKQFTFLPGIRRQLGK